jgi:hypothetical protein
MASLTAETSKFAMVPTEIVRDATLPDPAKVLYVEIRTYAWESVETDCWASQARIAADLGWGVTKVKRWTAVLVERGLIEREQRRGKTGRLRLAAQEPSPPADYLEQEGSPPADYLPSPPADYEEDEVKKTEGLDSQRLRKHTVRRSRTFADTTTTNGLDPNVEERAEGILGAYDLAMKERLNREPKRRPGEVEAARRLAAEIDENEFGEVMEYILHGEENGFTLDATIRRGFVNVTENYATLVDRAAAAGFVTPALEAGHGRCRYCTKPFPLPQLSIDNWCAACWEKRQTFTTGLGPFEAREHEQEAS